MGKVGGCGRGRLLKVHFLIAVAFLSIVYTGPFHMTGFSGLQHASEMEAKDDFAENPACHSADCGDLDEQDGTTGG